MKGGEDVILIVLLLFLSCVGCWLFDFESKLRVPESAGKLFSCNHLLTGFSLHCKFVLFYFLLCMIFLAWMKMSEKNVWNQITWGRGPNYNLISVMREITVKLHCNQCHRGKIDVWEITAFTYHTIIKWHEIWTYAFSLNTRLIPSG